MEHSAAAIAQHQLVAALQFLTDGCRSKLDSATVPVDGAGAAAVAVAEAAAAAVEVTVVVAVAVAAAVPKAILRRGGLHKMLSSELAELVPQSGDARHCR